MKKSLLGLLVLLGAFTLLFVLSGCGTITVPGITINTGTPQTSNGDSQVNISHSWAGTWNVSGYWGTMALNQNGNMVTGTFTHEGGTINGTVSGNVLTGTWAQTDNSKGPCEVTMAADGATFSIKWKYQGDADWHGSGDKGVRQ